MLLQAPLSSYQKSPKFTSHPELLRDTSSLHMTRKSPSPKRSRPPLGPPTEVWIWRITKNKTGRGEHRKLVDNVRPDGWQHFWEQRDPGKGRYRIEFRDARRAIVKVEYYIKRSRQQGGQVIRTTGRNRPSKRKVPPPVLAWDPDAPKVMLPQNVGPEQSPAQSPKAAREYPPLEPPGQAPEGMYWRLRKNGRWDVIDPRVVPLPDTYTLLRLPSQLYVFVFAPDRRWPGYHLVRLRDGALCLIPQDE